MSAFDIRLDDCFGHVCTPAPFLANARRRARVPPEIDVGRKVEQGRIVRGRPLWSGDLRVRGCVHRVRGSRARAQTLRARVIPGAVRDRACSSPPRSSPDVSGADNPIGSPTVPAALIIEREASHGSTRQTVQGYLESRVQRTGTTSVRGKSPPLNSRDSPVWRASAYAQQSPRFKPQDDGPCRNVRTRRARAGGDRR